MFKNQYDLVLVSVFAIGIAFSAPIFASIESGEEYVCSTVEFGGEESVCFSNDEGVLIIKQNEDWPIHVAEGFWLIKPSKADDEGVWPLITKQNEDWPIHVARGVYVIKPAQTNTEDWPIHVADIRPSGPIVENDEGVWPLITKQNEDWPIHVAEGVYVIKPAQTNTEDWPIHVARGVYVIKPAQTNTEDWPVHVE